MSVLCPSWLTYILSPQGYARAFASFCHRLTCTKHLAKMGGAASDWLLDRI